MWGMGRSQPEFVEQYAVFANLSLIASIPIYLSFPRPPPGKEIGRLKLHANVVIRGLYEVEIGGRDSF